MTIERYKTDKYLKFWYKHLQENEKVKKYIDAARSYMKKNNYAKALKEINKGLTIHDFDLDLLALKAAALGELKKPKESLKYAKKALARLENTWGKDLIHKNLRKIRRGAAKNEWHVFLISLADLYGNILRALALDYMYMGQWKKAIPYLEEELKIFPKHIPALDDISKCYYQLKEYNEAKKYFIRSMVAEGCPKRHAKKLAKEQFAEAIEKQKGSAKKGKKKKNDKKEKRK